MIGLFYGHTRARKKVPEHKVSKWQDFISSGFLFQGLFSKDFFIAKI